MREDQGVIIEAGGLLKARYDQSHCLVLPLRFLDHLQCRQQAVIGLMCEARHVC